jgi:hypothetical protein
MFELEAFRSVRGHALMVQGRNTGMPSALLGAERELAKDVIGVPWLLDRPGIDTAYLSCCGETVHLVSLVVFCVLQQTSCPFCSRGGDESPLDVACIPDHLRKVSECLWPLTALAWALLP